MNIILHDCSNNIVELDLVKNPIKKMIEFDGDYTKTRIIFPYGPSIFVKESVIEIRHLIKSKK